MASFSEALQLFKQDENVSLPYSKSDFYSDRRSRSCHHSPAVSIGPSSIVNKTILNFSFSCDSIFFKRAKFQLYELCHVFVNVSDLNS